MQRTVTLCLVAVLAALALAKPLKPKLFTTAATATAVPVTTSPQKPEWANVFSAPFGLNIPTAGYVNKSSYFYYDWNFNQSTRIAYPEACLPDITEKPCDLIFNVNGCFLLAPKAEKPCCKLFNISSVPPNFLAPFNFSGVDIVPDMYGVNHTCDYWTAGPFKYWTDATTWNDVQFQHGPSNAWIRWNFGTLIFDKIPHSIFAMPDMCADSCDGLEHLKPETSLPAFFAFGKVPA